MIEFKKLKFIFYGIFLLYSIVFVSAACDYTPNEFKIYSSSNLVADYNNSNFFVYSKSDLVSNPLKIITYFNNPQKNCFSSVDDMKIKWFSTSSLGNSANSFSADVVSGSNYVTSFTHILTSISLTGTISPSFEVKVGTNTPIDGSFSIGVDDTKPSFDLFAFQPTDLLLKKNDTIRINYQVSDSQSKLKKLTISSSSNKIINFDSDNQTFTGLVEKQLTSSETFRFEVVDKLGNKNNRTVSFGVDDSGPTLVSHSKAYTYDGQRKVTYTAVFSDSSFGILPDKTIRVLGDFSSFSSSDYSSVLGVCSKQNDNISFSCKFNNIPINIKSTTNENIKFTAFDAIDNEKISQITDEIFVDNKKPEILDFYTINSLGNKDIISSNDNNVSIHLKFKDDSASSHNPTISVNFEGIVASGEPFADICTKLPQNTVECVWNLSSKVARYSGFDYTNLTYSVSITDYYQNTQIKSIKVDVDNVKPTLISSYFEKTQSIKDGILKSGEIVNFNILFNDKNPSVAGKYFVRGIFSNVNSGDLSKNDFFGSCSVYNVSAILCKFNTITLRNGFVNSSVTFEINDIAGNKLVDNLNVTIYKVGNETRKSFIDGKNFTILNPINRNRIADGSVDAWFTGELEKYPGEEGIQVVNYAISGAGCNESQFKDLLVLSTSLYPENVIIGTGDFQKDKTFNIKTELGNYPNAQDLNDKTMDCQLAVLKRDNTTVYPVELVNIKLKYQFYDMPGGDFVAQNAQSILDKATTIQETESWFRSIYGIYKTFDNICTTINTIDGVFSSLSDVWTGVSLALHGFVVTTPAAEGGDKVIYGTKSLFTTFNTGIGSAIRTMCAWVTCRQGTWLNQGAFADTLNKALSTSTYIGNIGCSKGIKKPLTESDYNHPNGANDVGSKLNADGNYNN